MTPNHDIQDHIYVVDIDLLSFAELQKRAECIRGNIEKGNNAFTYFNDFFKTDAQSRIFHGKQTWVYERNARFKLKKNVCGAHSI